MSRHEESKYMKKSNIKFALDTVFLVLLLVLVIFVSVSNEWSPLVLTGVGILFVLYLVQYTLTRIWILKELRKEIHKKELKFSDSASEIIEQALNQKNAIVKYDGTFKQTANNIDKIKSMSFSLKQSSKEILHNVSQSLKNTDIEQKPVQANIDKMIVLKQRIHIISE